MGEDARDQGDQRGQRDAWKGLAGRFKTAADAVTAEMQAMPRDESQVWYVKQARAAWRRGVREAATRCRYTSR